MTELDPAPVSLGLESPILGPWFSNDAPNSGGDSNSGGTGSDDPDSTEVTLPTPGDDLELTFTIPANGNWLPPASGLLSYAVATDPPPPILAGLRGPTGRPPFRQGQIVLVHRLLPEVETRLGALLAQIPPADGTAPESGLVTRQIVRTFALELPEPATLEALKRGDPVLNGVLADDKPAQSVGLTAGDAGLGNGDEPMTDLKRPGLFSGLSEPLFKFPDATKVRLFAFDQRGRGIDPGAVAAWWTRLATTFTNLFAAGLGPARTVGVEPQLTIQLVGPDGAPAHEGVLSRLNTTNTRPHGATNPRPDGAIHIRKVEGDEPAPAKFTLTGGSADAAPVPRAAVLPAGSYGPGVELWADNPVGDQDDDDDSDDVIARDFIRVALLDVERHLIGQPRVAPADPNTEQERRAADQARETTRTLVDRASTTEDEFVLLPTAEDGMDALVSVMGAGPATVVAPVLDRGAGVLETLEALEELDEPENLPPDSPPPVLPDTCSMTALIGGGAAENGTVVDQHVLVELTLDSDLAGAWVRVWPQYFNAEKGVHERGAGGGGRANDSGVARAVVRLADGVIDPQNRMGLDIMVVTAGGAMRYPEVRLERPEPVGGAKLSLADAADVPGTVIACETGQSFAGDVPTGELASGSTLVAIPEESDQPESSGPATLIDPSSIPDANWNDRTVAAVLHDVNVLQLTEPAWKGWRGGEDAAGLTGPGTVRQILRTGLARLAQVGSPLPTQSRDEVAASVLTDSAEDEDGEQVADGVVAGIRPLAAHHELLPHQNGHPGAPGDDERHGAGARLRGPAVVGLAEILRERVAGTTTGLAGDAVTPLPTPPAPTGPSSWAATLRTVAAGVEAEPGLTELLDLAGTDDFPLDGPLEDIRGWLEEVKDWLEEYEIDFEIPEDLEEAGDAAADSIVRAINRRLLGARRGYREAATALVAAFERAQDFVYIETPALDDLSIGTGNDALNVWQALVDRATANPHLRVLICLPAHLASDSPAKLQRVRDQGAHAARDALRAAAGDRLAVFNAVTGPGRSLRLDATSVVVDDAWALTGGTHLWRRGLSFDSSLAVAVFDERLTEGRPSDVIAFRRALIAGRLGLAPNLLPEDPDELVTAVSRLSRGGGGLRLSPETIDAPTPGPNELDDELDVKGWNPDGSPSDVFNFMEWLLTDAAAGVRGGLEQEVPGSS